MPTLLSAAGDIKVTTDLLQGKRVGSMIYKVHLDGYEFLPHLTGKIKEGPRKEIFYFAGDGDLTALRYEAWKFIFVEQRETGTLNIWAEPFVPLRVPRILNLRRDPYEIAPITSNTHYNWMIDCVYM